ncbi:MULTISPECIES: YceK/YidQ family lipoprotein [Stutzerimonas stutzeri subgroup]|uniref:YceK/YidQ family lipoprotein n=1 Tax=Stutzerimonas kunmingensis TaxID=1211807 RepID=A0A9X1SQW3_9GAMM|nr:MULTISPECIES: YceK/YidQ family lipoprotein [Stutzerimonas stutzeri subgroup]MBF6622137.1 YceK/YidQ family lipoprotein [Stutzerimonas stutzeri]MCD1609383.1 YceK/YidQ family lipoprotein [Stutzerimonas kunmingensis]MCQ4240160.1 YceK/YidQ family lipoprotein [Stutzerimonas stutzeri]PNG00867.1 YceK/YidQ family lipoprotein [Stutzerimonas kunmingensis]
MIGRALLLLVTLSQLGGCATVRTLDAAKPGAPIIYSGTRLDWYSLNGGCCPMERFGAMPPKHAALDLPASVVLDTLLLPFAVAAELGVGLGVRGGL